MSIICFVPSTIELSYRDAGTNNVMTIMKTRNELFVQTRHMLLHHPT